MLKRTGRDKPRPVRCRMATDRRSGCTPALPYPPTGTSIFVKSGPVGQEESVAPLDAGGTKRKTPGVRGRSPCESILMATRSMSTRARTQSTFALDFLDYIISESTNLTIKLENQPWTETPL